MAASDIDEIVGVVLHIILNIIKVMCKWIRGGRCVLSKTCYRIVRHNKSCGKESGCLLKKIGQKELFGN